MKVRLAVPDDEDAVIELGRLNVAETHAHLGYDESIARMTFRRAMLHGNPTVFVVESRRGDLAGFLIADLAPYYFTAGFFVDQQIIYVRSDRRGTRAAALLVRAYNEWADVIDAREVYAGVANGQNVERTSGFLEKFGFKKVGCVLKRVRGAAHG